MIFFGCNLLNVNSLKCISMNNLESKIRPEIVNVNSDETIFYPYSVKANKYSSSFKNIKLKVFNLMSRTNETRYIRCIKLVNVNVD